MATVGGGRMHGGNGMAGGLNQQAWRLCEQLGDSSQRLRVCKFPEFTGGDVAGGWDFGVQAEGGLEAGLLLASVCLAGSARVALQPAEASVGPWPMISVTTDHPVAACMASQYAGWKIQRDGFFAMGSGPMRAAAAVEPLFEELAYRESPAHIVGVCETSQVLTRDVLHHIASEAGVAPDQAIVLVAPTRSMAGTVQVVARSIETALHQMHTRGWDLSSVVTAFGTAPLPPVAAQDLEGIGRTNDAILYGGQVWLWLRGDDAQLQQLATQIHSSASPDYGQPFADVFRRYDCDFYKVDPALFAPAVVRLMNLNTGRTFTGGKLAPSVLAQSFGETP